jgi:hypothetical protein
MKFKVWDKIDKCWDVGLWLRSDGKLFDVARRIYNTPNIEIEPVELDRYGTIQVLEE